LADVGDVRTGGSRYSARKDEILAVATAVLNEQGSRGFTLAGVAKRLDLNPVSLTYYFKRREDLAVACLLSTIDRYHAFLAAAETAGGPEARITAFLRRLLEERRLIRLGQQPALASFFGLRGFGQGAGTPLMTAYFEMFDRIGRLLKPDPNALELRRQKLFARLVIAQVSWMPTWLEHYAPDDHARIADSLADILAHGLATPGRQWRPAPPMVLGACEVDTGEISRERFLVAATDLINVQGYRGASIDKISAALNVTKGSFYYYNSDKDDLVVACFQRTLDILDEALRRAEGGDGWARLSSAAVSLGGYQASGARGRMLRNFVLAALPPHLRQPISAGFETISDGFVAIIDQGVADGSIRPVDSLIASQMIMTMANSAAYLHLFAAGFEADDIVPNYVRPALMGFLEQG
jgi:AcrR family transcriptional regulator